MILLGGMSLALRSICLDKFSVSFMKKRCSSRCIYQACSRSFSNAILNSSGLRFGAARNSMISPSVKPIRPPTARDKDDANKSEPTCCAASVPIWASISSAMDWPSSATSCVMAGRSEFAILPISSRTASSLKLKCCAPTKKTSSVSRSSTLLNRRAANCIKPRVWRKPSFSLNSATKCLNDGWKG